MSIEKTLCIIKPNAVEARVQGAILQRLLDEGFRVLAMRQLLLSRSVAEGFYAVHSSRPFFGELCDFMTRSPVVVVALERENAVAHYRKVIGATNPAQAEAGTIRQQHGKNIQENAVHGSDSAENGVRECSYFFNEQQLTGRA